MWFFPKIRKGAQRTWCAEWDVGIERRPRGFAQFWLKEEALLTRTPRRQGDSRPHRPIPHTGLDLFVVSY